MTESWWQSGDGRGRIGARPEEADSELRIVVRLLRKWWWLLVLGTIVAAGVSLLISRNTQPIYEAAATVYIQPINASGLPSTRDLEGTRDLAAQLTGLVTIRDNLAKVAENSGTSYTVPQLERKVSAHTSGSLLIVVAQDPNPTVAADLADTAATVLIDEYRTSQLVYISQFEALLNQYGVSDVGNIISAQVAALGGMRLIETASVPGQPIVPRTQLDAILAAMVGLVASGLLALGLERLDDRVRTATRLQEYVGLPLLGRVSHRGSDVDGLPLGASEGIEADHWVSQFAFIHTNLEFSLLGKGDGKLVLVTSARPREGKTTVASRLAVAAATAGDRVILVDLDLRAPSLHRVIGQSGSPGFTDAVLGNATMDEVLRETEVGNLKIVLSGRIPPHPTAVLHSETARSLIAELKQHADLVILDSPPCLAAPDALVLSALADGTLVVANAKSTKRGMLTEAVRSLEQSNARLVGTVLNDVRDTADGYYTYDYGRNGRVHPGGIGGRLKRLVGLGAN